MELAELPGRTIHVDANAIVAASTVSDIKEQVISDEITSTESENSNETLIKTADLADPELPWKWLSLILFILWSTTLIFMLISRRKSTAVEVDTDKKMSSKHYLKQIKQACKQNDPVMTKQALLEWAKNSWPNNKISSINAIKEISGEEFRLNLDKLNSCLYGKTSSQWDGAEFLKGFESQTFKTKQTTEANGNLEPLYRSLSLNK